MYDHLLQLRGLLPSLAPNGYSSVINEIETIDKYLTQKYSAYANVLTT